jgi:DNA-binding response OmpR family regulator
VNPRARQLIESPDQPAILLLVSPYPDDHLLLPGILNGPDWQWHKSQGCREALELLESHAVTVLLCERDQPDGRWQDLLEGAAKRAAPPSLIVFSRLADEYLWAEVLNLGGYDVLIKPFDSKEVLRVTSSAWRSWKDRCAALAAIAAKEQPKKLVSAA